MSGSDDLKDVDLLMAAKRVSASSGDPRTQVGCVIAHPQRGLVSEAANDFPCGVVRDARPSRLISPEKYKWIEHAERRAIYKAARTGAMTDGATVYLYGGFPCAECARAIIEAGICRVVYSLASSTTSHWDESYKVARQLFTEVGVSLEVQEEPGNGS